MKTEIENPAADYFSLFELPRKLQVDVEALQEKFYAESRRLHPDRYAGKPAEEQEWATERSSLLNDAYRTLKDPIARTEYLLKLEGVELEEQSKAATDAARATGGAKQQVVPEELLEEVFELNMQLQEMKMAHEMGEAPDADVREGLQAARANFEGKLADLDRELRGAWTEWDEMISTSSWGGSSSANPAGGDDAGRVKLRDRMVDVLNRRNYVRNLVRDVNAALESA